MDSRIRAHSEVKWLRAWEKRYAKAGSERQKRELKKEKKEWKSRRAVQHTLVQAAASAGANDQYLQSPNASSTNAHGVLTDQYGTPIANYGTVYPKPQGNLLQQASTLEAYTASLKHSDALLEDTRNALERSVGGIENIVDGLRNGYATKGLDASAAKAQQAALHLSLRAAIRAREDRRKKTDAMARANRNVLDELRRQEAVIMDRSKDVEEHLANKAFEKQAKAQQAKMIAQQQQQIMQQMLLAQSGFDHSAGGAGRRPPIGGHRPKSSPNLGLGGTITGVDPYWYEQAEPSFTTNMISYNNSLKANLTAAGQTY
jgi:hypothetical protein